MKTVWLAATLMLFSSVALADGSVGGTPNLQAALMRGEERGQRVLHPDKAAIVPSSPKEAAGSVDAKAQTPNDLDQVLLSLVNEVESLKTKVVVTARNSVATQNPRERKNIGSKTIYTYEEGQIYEVHAGVDRVTDIELGAGEYLTNPPVAGDTVRWKLSVLEGDKESNKPTHLVVKPIEEGIETNLLLTTNKNVYHLKLVASDWYMPAISWTYPEEEAKKIESSRLRRKQQERVNVEPEQLNFNYEIKGGRDYGWRPSQVFDDGEKTYLKMPPEMKTTEAPALFLLDSDSNPMLVNYRVKGQFYIIDRLFQRAELRVGKRERVEIRSERYKPSFLDRLF